MSKAKNSLIMILRDQIQQLQPEISKLDEQSLIKQLSKNKILYHISNKENQLELVYSYIALAEYYLLNQFYEPAVKILNEAQDVKETGDSWYFIGVALYKLQRKQQAEKAFANSLKSEWIEPSDWHRQQNMLQSINYLQKLDYDKFLKSPQKKQEIQKRIINLCYQKINIIKQFNIGKNQNYYFALTMGDLAQIFIRFQEYETALQKIKTGIKMLVSEPMGMDKLVEYYYCEATINQKLKKQMECVHALKNAVELIEQMNKSSKTRKFPKKYEDVYYLYVKKTLQV